MYLKKIVFFIFFFTHLLNAIIYEDAEDKGTFRWKIVNGTKSEEVKNIYDEEKASRVINFKGKGTRSAFKLTDENAKSKKVYLLSWEMKFSEDFVIIVAVNTTDGTQYLIYTPGDNLSYMQYGLGEDAKDGYWHKYERNIEEDLRYFDNRSRIKSLNSFVVRGSGSIDNLTITNSIKKVKEKVVLPKKKVVFKPKKSRYTNSTPKIKMNGKNPIRLNLGENYYEKGVYAYDKEDGELEVTILEDVNSEIAGKYMVLYMSTDSDGNTAVDRRHVIVGDESSKKSTSKAENVIQKRPGLEESEYEDGYMSEDKVDEDMDNIAYEMEMWEKNLEEEELMLKEKYNY